MSRQRQPESVRERVIEQNGFSLETRFYRSALRRHLTPIGVAPGRPGRGDGIGWSVATCRGSGVGEATGEGMAASYRDAIYYSTA